MGDSKSTTLNYVYALKGIFLIAFSLFFFIVPAFTVLREITDPNISAPGIPRVAWKLHKTLTPKFEAWSRKRLQSSRATEIATHDISGTEWPLFGSVFYLWATESLQDAWDKSSSLAPVAPKVYANAAVQSATSLVIDPGQANWVKTHWGTNYLKTQNVFYRMLVVAVLTSHARLTGDPQYLPMLKDQVESFSRELDASPHGLLDDYPSQCFPGDVLTAIAMIRKADAVLGTDHSAFASRAIRAFQGEALDPRGLVPYAASAKLGTPIGPSRGCGNSYVSLVAPQLWPAAAEKWYDLYTKYFWQNAWTAVGFREFPNDMVTGNWYMDVDAGPVLKGFGFAACAFGAGAARVNGYFEHAYPLTAEMLATSWPLADGTQLLPRALSRAADAPYLGEAAILYNLTRLPAPGVAVKTGGSIPTFVFICVALQLIVGLLLIAIPIRSWRRRRINSDSVVVSVSKVQFGICTALLFISLVLVLCGAFLPAIVVFLLANLFPRNSAKHS